MAADPDKLQRSARVVISSVLNNGGISGAIHCTKNSKNAVSVCGFDEKLVANVSAQLESHIKNWGSSLSVKSIKHSTLIDDCSEDFHHSKYVALVAKADVCDDPNELSKLLFAYRLAKGKKANTIVLLVRGISSKSDFSNGVQKDSAAIQSLMDLHPEFRILYNHMRVHFLLGDSRGVAMETASHILFDWLQGTLPDDTPSMACYDFNDAYKIFSRELQEYIPELRVLARILTMCFVGFVSVLVTLLILILLSKDIGLTTDIRKARQHLKTYLEDSRSGRSEWGRGHDPMALIALQLNDPSWCVSSEHNQRTVDRLEINILSELSRLGTSRHKDITASKLSLNILALLATYQNPQNFHDFNLVAILQRFIATHIPYNNYDNFSFGHYVAALCNAGVQLPEELLHKLLSRQTSDGSFPLGLDETSMSVLALSCFDQDDAKLATRNAINFIIKQRKGDGSYGIGTYSTALVIQALNISNTYLSPRERSTTLSWLVEQSWNGQVERDILVTAQVLITLAGKSVMSIRETIGYLQKLFSSELTIHKFTSGKRYDAYKYVHSDATEATRSPNVEKNDSVFQKGARRRNQHCYKQDFISFVTKNDVLRVRL